MAANVAASEVLEKQPAEWKPTVVWLEAIAIGTIHLLALEYIMFHPMYVHPYTVLWGLLYGVCGGLGVTAGVHRLWTHRAYKAKTPLKVILAICYSIAGQNSIFHWVRDHRVHHKFSETDADPHNSNRGFFFAHVGWLMMRRHPEVIRKGRQIDMSDILEDPVVKLHTKYFTELKIFFCFLLPTIIPHYLWAESWFHSIVGAGVFRYVVMLNGVWLINSAAHTWGTKPFDNRIKPGDNRTLSFFALGEGWHNYHHVFPWDYKAAELGDYCFNLTTAFIDAFAKIGWAYDLKSPSQDLVKRVAERYGDGTHPQWGEHMKEVREEDDPNMKILHPFKVALNAKLPLKSFMAYNGTSIKRSVVIHNRVTKEIVSPNTVKEIPESEAEKVGEVKHRYKV